MPRQLRIGTLLLLAIIQWDLVGCGPRMAPPPAPFAVQPIDSTVTPLAPASNTPDPLLAPPSTAIPEELLGDTIDLDAPTITVPVTMTKAALAAELYTTPALLDFFTQGLPDPVPQYYIVVVPRTYLAGPGESLSLVAEMLALPPELLSLANPTLLPETPFEVETEIHIPRLYTAPGDTTAEEIAEYLQVSLSALLAANPALQTNPPVPSGALVIVPPK
jgi:hypothetical protein